MVNNVFFEPGARTHWHTHEVAQVLYVLAGEGRVQSRDGTGSRCRSATPSTSRRARSTGTGLRRGATCSTSPSRSGETAGSDAVADDDYREATGSAGDAGAPQRPRDRCDLRARRHGLRDRFLRDPRHQLRRGAAVDGRCDGHGLVCPHGPQPGVGSRARHPRRGAVGAVTYFVAVRPVLAFDRFSFAWLVSTLGVALILENVAALIWGPTSRSFPALLTGTSGARSGARC